MNISFSANQLCKAPHSVLISDRTIRDVNKFRTKFLIWRQELIQKSSTKAIPANKKQKRKITAAANSVCLRACVRACVRASLEIIDKRNARKKLIIK